MHDLRHTKSTQDESSFAMSTEQNSTRPSVSFVEHRCSIDPRICPTKLRWCDDSQQLRLLMVLRKSVHIRIHQLLMCSMSETFNTDFSWYSMRMSSIHAVLSMALHGCTRSPWDSMEVARFPHHFTVPATPVFHTKTPWDSMDARCAPFLMPTSLRGCGMAGVVTADEPAASGTCDRAAVPSGVSIGI